MGGGCHRGPPRAGAAPTPPAPRPRPSAPKRTTGCAAWSTRTRTSVAEASRVFAVPVSTIYRWRQTLPARRPLQRSNRARAGPVGPGARPGRRRRSGRVLALRGQHPRMGKLPLQVLLAPPGRRPERVDDRPDAGQPAPARQLLREPHAVRIRRARRPVRPYATRVPKDKRTPTAARRPDPARHDAPAPPARGRTAPVHRDRRRQPLRRGRGPGDRHGGDRDGLSGRAPRPDAGARPGDPGRRRVGVHGGVRGGLPATGASRLYVLPPRSPKLNGRVERLNGTARREFWECYDGDLDLPALQAALRAVGAPVQYRPTPSSPRLRRPPAAVLSSQSFSDVSN